MKSISQIKWMLFGIALLLLCMIFNQFVLPMAVEYALLFLPVALIGFVIILLNLIPAEK